MKRKNFYTKVLGKKVAAHAKLSHSNRYHVILSDNQKWAVVADGNTRASRVLSDQNGAINFAKEMATKSKGEVIIHTKTGEVEDLVSFAK
jgi:uncharacterized protein YdaT